MKTTTPKARVYKLKTKHTPLSLMLASRNTTQKPLIYFDEEKMVNRPLRYAVNQQSIFEDEQDGSALLGTIVFEDGFLSTRREDVLLQNFLELHPDKGIIFEEVDHEKNAERDLEYINAEVDALISARELSVEEMETLGRVLIGGKVDSMKTSELKRDILIFARDYPMDFLDALDNDDMALESLVKKMFADGMLSFRKKSREVYYNLPNNKKRLLLVKHGESHVKTVMSYFHTDPGMEVLGTLENLM